MKEPILGRQIPRPIESLKDVLKGRLEPKQEGAPMAPDVETVLTPGKRKPLRRPPNRDR
jgi:hypothetical protein